MPTLRKKLKNIDKLIYWIVERESIRLKRFDGKKPPWTKDKILANYRFCNVRRMDDRVSAWLLKEWYSPYFDHHNMLYACALARFINLPSSLELITPYVFEKSRGKHLPIWEKIKSTLRGIRDSGNTVFNGAYVVRGNDGIDKISSVVDYYVKPLVKLNRAAYCINPNSMEDSWEVLTGYHGFGSFMAGQVVADLRHAIVGQWIDRNTWAPLGPGSLKGINYVYGREPKQPMKQAQFVEELAQVREYCESVLPKSITSRLEMMDWQNCMCEFRAYYQAINGIKNPKRLYKHQ